MGKRFFQLALVAWAALSLAAAPARAQVVIKPRVLVLIDTSGSMVWHFDSDTSCGGDGDGSSSYRDFQIGPNNWYPGTDGTLSRLYAAKQALTAVINATGDIDFGLMRYGLSAMCADAHNCCTFANPRCFNTMPPTDYVDGPLTFDGGCGTVQGGVSTDGGQILALPAALKGQFNPGSNLDPLQWVDGVEDFRDRGDGWPRNGELRAQGPTPLAGSARTALSGWFGPIYDVSKKGSPGYNANDPLFDPQFDCRPYVFIAMTDGADTCDNDSINGPPGAVADLLARNPANPVKTYVVGLAISDQQSVNVLNSMAKQGSTGAARFANSQTDIEAAFADIAASSIKVELCNGVDDNCNQLVDEGFDKGSACAVGVGQCRVAGMKKCDPGNNTQTTCCVDDGKPDGPCAVVKPGPPMPEVCNGVDDDCNGVVDDPPACDIAHCFPEVCNGKDDDCDGIIDNHLVDTGRDCGLDVGLCRHGSTTCHNSLGGDVGGGAPADGGDHLVCAGGVTPVPEKCNGLDDDCDGIVDGMTQACYDGAPGTNNVASCHSGLQQCTAVIDSGRPAWGPCLGEIVPVAESCNGLDDDCDGVIDDVKGAGDACCPSGKCGVGACVAGTQQCSGGNLACLGGQGPSPEICNGLDDDCNGAVDDLPSVGRPCQPHSGGCVGRLACDVANRALTCVPGAPGLEICNGIDDNCNGLVDEEPDVARNDPRLGQACGPGAQLPLPCAAGQTTCRAGAVVCSGGQGPTTEVCNCIDDDCNGLLDDGATCPGGYQCVDGFCLPLSLCSPPCKDGFLCIGRSCIDRCLGVNCPATYRCDHGSCVDDSCATDGRCAACDGTSGERCDPVTRGCVPDLCCGRSCNPDNQFCDPSTGGCRGTCIGKRCGDGQVCFQGECQPDRCAGVRCGELSVCDPKTGQCAVDACAQVECPPGLGCCRGTCQEDLCALIACPTGYRCVTDPFDCTLSCDTPITPFELQDKVASGGGSGLVLGCSAAPSRAGGGGVPLGLLSTILAAVGLSARRRAGRPPRK
jgi:hypothetical protein